MKRFIYALRADFVKYFGEFRYYQFNYWLGTIMNLILFTGIVKGITTAAPLGPQQFLSILTGFLIWWYGTSILAEMSLYIQEEVMLGTLEQVLTTATSLPVFILSKVLATLCRSTFWIIVFLVPTGLFFRHYLTAPHFDYFGAVLVVAITIVSFIGFGLILLGLSLIFTRVGALVGLIEYALLFLSGIFFSITGYPHLLRLVVSAIPLTWGVTTLRLIVVDGMKLSQVIRDLNFARLLLTTLIYLIIGGGVYRWGWRHAQRTGRLAHY